MATNSKLNFGLPQDHLRANRAQDLRSPGVLARWPAIGITMFLLGSITLITLAYFVTTANGSFLKWDIAATQALHARLQTIPSSLVEYVIFGFFAGKEMVIVIGALLAIYFIYKRFWGELAMVLLGLGGGALIWYLLNEYFARPRPAGQMPVLPLTDPSFPSGLAMAAILCYGLLAYLLVPKVSLQVLKWILAIALLLIIALIGLSAVVSGSHYVSDVLAGYALGLAWAGLVYTLMERYFEKDSTHRPSPAQKTADSEGLRSPGWFRSRPILGLSLVLAGFLLFAGLAFNLKSKGPLLQVDTAVYHDLIAEAQTAPPVVNEVMIFGFFLGKQIVLLIVTILCIYFLYKRYWRELAMLLLSSAAGSIAWNLILDYFARPRPSIQTGLVVKTLPSFPSGHTMSTLIVYGFLAYLLIPKMPSRTWKWAVAIAAIVVILFVGFSRVFQGGHYLTDAVAGYGLGLAWAGLVYLFIENIFWRKKS